MTNRAGKPISYKFSGHQTFPFRYGWLEKGVNGIKDYPDLFYRDDAIVTLGVGKNMVASIRHWCQLAQLIETIPEEGRRVSRLLSPTEIARKLLVQKAWDPFLEDDASLWLIHWLIVTNPTIGTSWKLLFSRYNRPDFTRNELKNYLRDFIDKENFKVGETVLNRDVDCLIRSYVTSYGSKNQDVMEESFVCPLLQLSLIQPSPDGELYRFAIGPKPSLPVLVFAYALNEHFGRWDQSTETMSIQECLYGDGSPGQVFKLDENSLIEYLEELEDQFGGGILLDETAGLKQIYRRKSFDSKAFLEQYYSRNGSK